MQQMLAAAEVAWRRPQSDHCHLQVGWAACPGNVLRSMPSGNLLPGRVGLWPLL